MTRPSGIRLRNFAVLAFDLTVLLAFPCHAVESSWYWGATAGVLILSAATIVVLEGIRLIAPGFVDGWWDDE